jgi:CTP synthase
VQFHPEYRSTVGNPHPLFASFVRACVTYAEEKDNILTPKGPRREKKIHLASAKM